MEYHNVSFSSQTAELLLSAVQEGDGIHNAKVQMSCFQHTVFSCTSASFKRTTVATHKIVPFIFGA